LIQKQKTQKTNKKWAILQLSERGEQILEDEPTLLENLIKKHFVGDYFFPLYFDKSKDYNNRIFLIQGYVFIEFSDKNKSNFFKISNSPYFLGPLMVNKTLQLLPDIEIGRMRKQLHKITRPIIKIGDTVMVMDGKYKNLKAIITEYYLKDKKVDLSIELKCMSIIASGIPIAYLKNLTQEEQDKTSLQGRILETLKQNPNGITRKTIIQNLILLETEKTRLSSYLIRLVKKGIIKAQKNKIGQYVFFLK
jgi:transcription antitermination factor NusG